jgi:signal transduction histidine kinase
MNTSHKISGALDMGLSPHDQAVRLMGSWISAIADQVKNPVAGISAAALLIEKEMTNFRSSLPWEPALVEEAVRLMIERLAKFDNYLAELSGFTRPVILNSHWLDLRAEWPGIEQFLARRITAAYRLRVKFEGSGMIYADSDRLRGALAAIITNSIDASGSTIDPDLRVNICHMDESADVPGGCRIHIEDNGPGFSREALLHALVPFFTTKEAGTGIGLAMVEKHVRAHGGTIRFGNCFADSSADGLTPNHLGGAFVELFFPSPPECTATNS